VRTRLKVRLSRTCKSPLCSYTLHVISMQNTDSQGDISCASVHAEVVENRKVYTHTYNSQLSVRPSYLVSPKRWTVKQHEDNKPAKCIPSRNSQNFLVALCVSHLQLLHPSSPVQIFRLINLFCELRPPHPTFPNLEDGCHLRCSAVWTGTSLPTFQRSVLPPSSGRWMIS
jgi:hypothetical protein